MDFRAFLKGLLKEYPFFAASRPRSDGVVLLQELSEDVASQAKSYRERNVAVGLRL